MSDDPDRKHVRDWEALLLSGAREVARTGDRWFVAVVEDAVGAGRWARREADVIGDSMSAALETTIDVAKKLRRERPAPDPTATPNRSRPRPPNIGVLDTLDEVGDPAASELASHRAGIAPLLSALREVVSSRAADGYESLQSDERFWALLELIHEHGSRAPASAAPGERSAENEGS